MLRIAFDLETHPFDAVCKTPPPICLSYAEIVVATGSAALAAPRYEIGRTGVLPFFRGRGPAVDALVQWFRLAAAGEAHIIGANTSYDIFTGIVGAYQRGELIGDATLGRALFRSMVQAYDANAVTDVLVRQKLIDLASGDFRKLGNYNLATVAKRHGAKELDKRTEEEGGWRTRFNLLEWLEPQDYPREAYEYSLEDAIATAQAWIGQANLEGHRGSVSDPKIIRNFGAGANALLNEFHQVRAALVLADMSNYGLRTDPRAVAEFKREVDEALDEVRDELLDAGLIRREYKKNKEGIEAYIAAKGYSGFARTPSGALSMPRKALEATGDPLLRDIANWAEHVDAAKEKRSVVLERLVSSGLATCEDHRNTKMAAWRQYMAYVHPKALELDNEPRECPRTDTYDPKAPDAADPLWCVKTDAEACDASGDPLMQAYAEYAALGKALSTDIPILESGLNTPIHSYFEVLLETGRVASSKPNVMNLRRLPGLRECFVPRKGFVFCDVDYPSLELWTLAQVCQWVLGYSYLGDALRAGKDPHLQMGAKTLGISYEEAKRRKKDPDVDNARTLGKGCFHPDTEVLTRRGWIRVGELLSSDHVASARLFKTGAVELDWEVPLALTERDWNGHLLHLKNEGMDLRLTPDHRMCGWWDNDEIAECLSGETGRLRYWPNAGVLGVGSRACDERLLRLAVAVQADGHFYPNGRIKLGFTKQRKILRLQEMLREDEYDFSSTGAAKVSTFFLHDDISRKIRELLTTDKMLPFWWTELIPPLRRLVVEEAEFWDSSGKSGAEKRTGYTYCSIHRQNVEVLQTLATLSGFKTSAHIEQRSGNRRDMYHLSVKKRNRSRGGNLSVSKIPYTGKVFCLKTRNDTVVVRDGGVPVITRQCNFGVPGGLGKKTFAVYAFRNYKVRITEEKAGELIQLYKQQWTEMPAYFKWIESLKSDVQRTIKDKHGQVKTFDGYNVVQPWSGRLRAGATYCAACNSPFQGLGSEVAKEALWLVFKAQYGFSELGEQDPMFVSRSHIALFVHDQIVSEALEEHAHAAGWRLAELMRQASKTVMPDSAMVCEPTLSRQLSKKAVTLYRSIKAGGLVTNADAADRDELGRPQLAVWDLHEACDTAVQDKLFAGVPHEELRAKMLKDKWPEWVTDASLARLTERTVG